MIEAGQGFEGFLARPAHFRVGAPARLSQCGPLDLVGSRSERIGWEWIGLEIGLSLLDLSFGLAVAEWRLQWQGLVLLDVCDVALLLGSSGRP